MQPLISPVDHEARYDENDDAETEIPQEHTRLLGRPTIKRKSSLTTLFIAFISLIFIFGITIGVYLLVEQERAWPVSLPFELVYRENWGANPPRWIDEPITGPAEHIILTHTCSETCRKLAHCKDILLGIQNLYQSDPYNESDIPFNFMVSHGGETYEGRSWNISGKIDKNIDRKSMSVAVIGNFTVEEPTLKQLMEIKALINESIRRRVLSTNFTLLGRPFRNSPEGLFKLIKKWKNWIPKL